MRIVWLGLLVTLASSGVAGGFDYQEYLDTLDSRQVWTATGGQVEVDLRTANPGIFGVQIRHRDRLLSADEWIDFRVVGNPDLRFLAPFGNFERFEGGRMALASDLELEYAGQVLPLDRLFMVPARPGEAPGLILQDEAGRDLLRMTHLHVLSRPGDGLLEILNGDLVAAEGLAERLGFPDPDVLFFGTVRMALDLDIPAGADISQDPADPCPTPTWPQEGPEADVKLISMRQIQQTGGGATNPDGAIKITPAAELEGAGVATVPWVGKFNEIDEYTYEPRDQHPYLVWAMYRIHDGRIEMLGRSGAKHARITVNTSCPCPGGNILWPGCRDEYGVGINDFGPDLGPRSDVKASLGLFETCGSFFDPDCIGEQTQGSGSGFENRLVVHPDEFQLDGASYFIDSWCVVQYDVDIWNTMGYRPVNPQPVSGGWSFDPGAFLQGPPIGEWVETGTEDPMADHLSIVIPSATPDEPYPGNVPQGHLRLLVRASDTGDGRYRYNYALQNFDFDRGVDRFAIPLAPGTEVHETRFGGPDGSGEWSVEIGGAELVFQAPEGEILPWFTLYNFEIEVSAPPVETSLILGLAGDAVAPVYEAVTLGPATTVGMLSASPSQVDFGSLPAGGVADPESVTLSNTGQATVTVNEQLTPAAPFELSGDCPNPPFELAPEASCQLQVGFSPEAPGNYTDELVLVSDAQNTNLVIPLAGDSLPPPEFSVSPLEVDFGSVEVGQSAQALVELANPGQVEVQVDGFDLPNEVFSVDVGDCGAPPFELAPDQGCELVVAFAPAEAESYQDVLLISSSADDSPHTVELAGAGVEPVPELSVSPMTIDFGEVEVGQGLIEPVVLTNEGSVDVAVSALVLPEGPFGVDPAACGGEVFALTPGESCTLEIAYAPDEVAEVLAELVIESDAGDSPHVVSLAGEGIETGVSELSLIPSSLDFGNLLAGGESSLSVMLVNTGTVSISISAIEEPESPFSMDASECGGGSLVLEPDDECSLEFFFSADETGTYSTSLDIESDSEESPHSLSISGVIVGDFIFQSRFEVTQQSP